MAFAERQLVTESSLTRGANRIIPRHIKRKTFAAGSGTIEPLTPVMVGATGDWVVWAAAISEITTITPTGTVSGGTFTLTVNGEVTAAIAYNATAAQIEDALEVLGGVDPGDVVATGGLLSAATPVVLTWGGGFAGEAPVVTVQPASITGGGTLTATETPAGVAAAGQVSGVVWPDPIVLAAGGEVLGQVMTEGEVHYDDLVLPAGQTADNLKANLRNVETRRLGLVIEGLEDVR